MAVTFIALAVTARLVQFFFPLHNFTDGKFFLTVDLINLSIWIFSFPFIKLKISTFSLKRRTLWLLFGIYQLPASQLLHFGTIKWNRVTWTRVLWYCDRRSNNWDGYWVTNGQCMQHGHAGQRDDSRLRWDGVGWCMMLLRMAHNMNLLNCLFWNFPFNIFRLQLTMGNGNCGK